MKQACAAAAGAAIQRQLVPPLLQQGFRLLDNGVAGSIQRPGLAVHIHRRL